MKIGEMLKVLREHKGWSQHDLSHRAKVSQSFISKLESGDAVEVSMAAFIRLVLSFEKSRVRRKPLNKSAKRKA